MSELPEGTTELIARALAEDLGPGDVTAEATVPSEASATARIVLKQPGVVFGLEVAKQVFGQVGVEVFERSVTEGVWSDAPPLDAASLRGRARAVLAGERVALNFLGHLSGISTLTALFVDAVSGTGARILDTRKTTPGMRLLEKQAVVHGGGENHRIGLYDAVLIKENHIAVAGGLIEAVDACRRAKPGLMIEVEAENVEEVAQAITAGADRILLDNMSAGQLTEAVQLRNASGEGRTTAPELEASGGIDLANVRSVAETGVDFISIGALTHSAPVLDFSLLVRTA